MHPLVSILIPAHNSEPWIKHTIESAINQTWPAKEIIIIDDGSFDKTASIARTFQSSNVKVISQNAEGASAARNRAFDLSKGDFIQWLDADDLLAPDKIERQMQMLTNGLNRRTLVSSEWARFVYRPSKACFHPTDLWCDLSPVEWLIRKLDRNLFMQTATWLVSRELSVAAGRWDTRMLSDDDGEYFCRVILASDMIAFCPGSKVFYRSTPSVRLSQIGSSERKQKAMLLSMKLHIGYVLSIEDSPRVRSACLQYLQNWLIHFYPERKDFVGELQLAASQLGGNLSDPQIRGKYSWISKCFGWETAKKAQMLLPLWKHYILERWEKMLSTIDCDVQRQLEKHVTGSLNAKRHLLSTR